MIIKNTKIGMMLLAVAMLSGSVGAQQAGTSWGTAAWEQNANQPAVDYARRERDAKAAEDERLRQAYAGRLAEHNRLVNMPVQESSVKPQHVGAGSAVTSWSPSFQGQVGDKGIEPEISQEGYYVRSAPPVGPSDQANSGSVETSFLPEIEPLDIPAAGSKERLGSTYFENLSGGRVDYSASTEAAREPASAPSAQVGQTLEELKDPAARYYAEVKKCINPVDKAYKCELPPAVPAEFKGMEMTSLQLQKLIDFYNKYASDPHYQNQTDERESYFVADRDNPSGADLCYDRFFRGKWAAFQKVASTQGPMSVAAQDQFGPVWDMFLTGYLRKHDAWEKIGNNLAYIMSQDRYDSNKSVEVFANIGKDYHQIRSKINPSLIESARKLNDQMAQCAAFASMQNSDLVNNNTAKEKATSKSSDGRIVCNRDRDITQDFEQCDTIVKAYDAMKVLDGVTDVATTTAAGFSNIDKQSDLMKDSSNPANMLKMQKSVLIDQSRNSYAKSTEKGIKLAVMWAAKGKQVTRADLINKCSSKTDGDKWINYQKENIEIYLGAFISNTDNLNPIKPCGKVVDTIPTLLANGAAFETASDVMAQSGVEAAALAAQAALLNSQADLVDERIKKIESYDPKTNSVVLKDALLAKCVNDPTLPECSRLTQTNKFGFGDNGLSFSIGDNQASVYDPTKADTASGGSASSGSGVAARTAQGIGGIGAAVDKGSSSEFAAIGAGGLADGTVGGGGGGGGGFSVGGASAPSGSGVASSGSGESGGGYGNYGAGGSYTKGAAGSAFSSGRGAMRAPASASDNPFAKLFGKGTNETLNFRDIASANDESGKSQNIFGVISKRYSKAVEGKRLLEYEAK